MTRLWGEDFRNMATLYSFQGPKSRMHIGKRKEWKEEDNQKFKIAQKVFKEYSELCI